MWTTAQEAGWYASVEAMRWLAGVPASSPALVEIKMYLIALYALAWEPCLRQFDLALRLLGAL